MKRSVDNLARVKFKPTIANKGRAGFTFIELILVTTLLLILAGVSTPLFRKSLSGIQAKDTAQTLVQLMRYAQAKAIAERKLSQINFDFSEGSFWLTVQSEASPEEYIRPKGKWGAIVTAPEGISLEGETELIVFYPDGTSDKAEIKISDQKGASFAISTQRTIRYVELEE